jgi:hypothetical protein
MVYFTGGVLTETCAASLYVTNGISNVIALEQTGKVTLDDLIYKNVMQSTSIKLTNALNSNETSISNTSVSVSNGVNETVISNNTISTGSVTCIEGTQGASMYFNVISINDSSISKGVTIEPLGITVFNSSTLQFSNMSSDAVKTNTLKTDFILGKGVNADLEIDTQPGVGISFPTIKIGCKNAAYVLIGSPTCELKLYDSTINGYGSVSMRQLPVNVPIGLTKNPYM